MSRATFCIAGCELRRALYAPLAWSLFAGLTLLLALIFYTNLKIFLQFGLHQSLTAEKVRNLFSWSGMLLMLISPLFTMYLLSEERRSGTLALLTSAPVRLIEIALGKFLAAWCLLSVPLLLAVLMPLSLMPYTDLDLRLVAIYLCSGLLLNTVLAALGLYMSSLTENPPAAAARGLFLLLILLLMEPLQHLWADGQIAGKIMGYLAIRPHYAQLLNGYIGVADVCYFLLLSTLFVSLSTGRLYSLRTLR